MHTTQLQPVRNDETASPGIPENLTAVEKAWGNSMVVIVFGRIHTGDID
ncbi:hypothetical protein ACIBF1_29895 [Spirillospora sp. NPDC050679]